MRKLKTLANIETIDGELQSIANRYIAIGQQQAGLVIHNDFSEYERLDDQKCELVGEFDREWCKRHPELAGDDETAVNVWYKAIGLR